MNNTEQNILKEKKLAKVFLEWEKETGADKWAVWDNIGLLMDKCYQLAQKENQSQQNKNTNIPHSTCQEEGLNGNTKQRAEVETGSADTQLQKYKKETAEKVEKLKEAIRNYRCCFLINGKTDTDSYVERKTINEFIDKIFKDNNKKEAEK